VRKKAAKGHDFSFQFGLGDGGVAGVGSGALRHHRQRNRLPVARAFPAHGRPLTVVYSGGTEFNFPNDVPHFDQYLASERRLASLAAGANATIVFNNQSQFNGAATKLRMLKDRHPGEAHPLDVGTNVVARYFKIEDECAQAVRLKVLAASGGRPQ
jgi:hypothetical protein